MYILYTQGEATCTCVSLTVFKYLKVETGDLEDKADRHMYSVGRYQIGKCLRQEIFVRFIFTIWKCGEIFFTLYI